MRGADLAVVGGGGDGEVVELKEVEEFIQGVPPFLAEIAGDEGTGIPWGVVRLGCCRA